MLVFLSGPMGAGKSAVSRVVSQRLGVPAIDLDAVIEARSGLPVSEFWKRHGEAAFRELEREIVLGLPSDGAVVALGGGTVTHLPTRRMLAMRGVLITLTAPVEVLAKRCGDGSSRPLLAGRDIVAVLRDLLVARGAAYAESHATIDTSRMSLSDVASRVVEIARDAPVLVALGERSYSVEIGQGIRQRLAARVAETTPGDVVLVHDDPERIWPREARALLEASGHKVVDVALPQGESEKTLETAARIWDAALDAGVDRRAIVVGVGGGVVGDLTAFAASTLLRGVPLAQLPTTLLSMVDSSVGGKTGFNRAQGKNLVGTFYQPRFVLCDVDTLGTLPREERIAGLAEVVKSAWLDGEAAVAGLEADADALREGDPEATVRAVRMSVSLKARVVAADENESGERMLLNLGHTVGHGLEAAEDYRGLRHGEGVALGMVAALRVGRALGTTSQADAERLSRLMSTLGLPTDLDSRLSDRVFGYVVSDKKKRGKGIRFIVPGRPGDTWIETLTVEQIKAAVVG